MDTKTDKKASNVCPYFDHVKWAGLTCTSNVPVAGATATQMFFSKQQMGEYFKQVCCVDYSSCAFLQVVVCRYNDGVECREKDRCDRCGWNPVVAHDRLLQFMSRPEKGE